VCEAGTTDGVARRRLLEHGLHTGYRLRKRASPMGCELREPNTRVEPFVVGENSLLAANPEAPI
jgi:hypothetical protein